VGGDAAEPGDEEEFLREDKVKDPTPEERPKARLFNPAWSAQEGYFNEKVLLSVEGELAPGSGHVTRVLFTVHALRDGETDRIGSQEGHLRDGKATAEIQLWAPQFRDEDGNLAQACEYAFKAKHRDSEEIESGRLKARSRAGAGTAIEFRLTLDGKTPRAGERYVVTASDGKVYEGNLDQEGRARIESAAPGEATVAFPDLSPSGTALGGGPKFQPGKVGATSPFYLRIHMRPEEARKLQEKFILTSEDESFAQTRTADDDLILGDDFIDLRFSDLPTDKSYTLVVETRDAPPYPVFRNVPFADLDGFVE
jgi:hypothetical protein